MFVIAPDWNLRGTVRAELREIGVEALGMEGVGDAVQAIAGGLMPDAIVLDATTSDASEPAMARLARQVPLVLVASRTEAAPELQAAAVLWRPVQVGEIVRSVRQVLEGRAA